ncbi:hypothetical protein GCM10009765_66810 [Fodinicola feengrottensis]|uniref:Uncharacterized protein n=1 Tax=Fodinicola feengrottensis TaxID=435914 RepID=A0ABN2IMC3_9ACTN
MVRRSGKSADERRARIAAAMAAKARARRRRQLMIWSSAAVVALVVVVGAVVMIIATTGHKSQAAPKASPTTAGTTANPPWAAPTDPSAAIQAAGLPLLSAEGTVEHIHAHLDVIADGKPVQVPAELGIDEAGGHISPLHTHDTTGVIHVESPVKKDFTLGQFFTEWRVSLASDHIGGLKVSSDQVFRAYVNGKLVQGDPAALVLHAHDEIALVYGTTAQQQNPPNKYAFPAGL